MLNIKNRNFFWQITHCKIAWPSLSGPLVLNKTALEGCSFKWIKYYLPYEN